MDNIILEQKYISFVNLLDKEIECKEFKNLLEKARNIDNKYYKKIILVNELHEIIKNYKGRKVCINSIENVQIILSGNPQIVFYLCIEAIRNNLNIILVIEDFCVAQNKLLVETINNLFKKVRFTKKVELKNQISYSQVIEISDAVDRTICIGNSNDYNRLNDKIKNLNFYPYNIFEVYCDSDEMNDLKKIICDYAFLNQYEIDIYDDMNIDDAIKAINRDGYGYCSLILSKDKEKIEKFKNKILSKNIFINENPFEKIEFDLKIN